MEERSGTAELAGSARDAEAQRLVATLSRSEVEDALRTEEPVDLVLDIQRVAQEDGRAETECLSLSWEQADLERLLASTSGDEVSLVFDEEELRRLLDQDVEAHGLRGKFAIVTAVVGLAAAGAGPASAALVEGTGTGGSTPVAAATQQVSASEVSTGLAGTPAASAPRPAASEISTGLASTPTDVPAATASEISTGLTPAAPTAPSLVSVRVAPAPPVAPSEISTGIAPGPGAVEAPGGSGTSVSWPSPGDAAIAGGVLLAITAAAFAVGTQRRPPATS